MILTVQEIRICQKVQSKRAENTEAHYRDDNTSLTTQKTARLISSL